MFSTDFIFRQQENLVDNQKSQAGYRPLRNKILLLWLNQPRFESWLRHILPFIENLIIEGLELGLLCLNFLRLFFCYKHKIETYTKNEYVHTSDSLVL